jgi:hypothetical protein
MDRQIIYPGQVPIETDLLLTNKNTMTAIAKLCAAVLGVASCVSGFATSQTVVPSLGVLVAAGDIYSLQNIDGTAYSSLAADTTHSIVKQGISLDPVTLPITPPATAGFSINYLIQVGYQDSDTGSTVLPYYNASNPAIAYSGPANSGAAQPTKRAGIVSIQAKAGTAATTGTQTTPAPDAGYTGLYVVTVANGASTVVNGNIAALATAPFINSTLHGLTPAFTTPVVVGVGTTGTHAAQLSQVAGVVGSTRNLRAGIAAAGASATFTADEVIVESTLGGARYCLPSFNKTINLGTTGAGGMDTGAAPATGWVAIYAIYNPTTSTSAVLAVNATAAAAPDIYGGANMPSGFTASALISVLMTTAGSLLTAFQQYDREVYVFQSVYSGPGAGTFTLLSIAGGVPKNAKRWKGNITATLTSTGQGSAALCPTSAGQANPGYVAAGFYANAGTSAASTLVDCPITTAQTTYFVTGGAGTWNINSYGFGF